MYPKLVVDKIKLKHNVSSIVNKCREAGISVMGVTKVFVAEPEIVNLFVEAGVDYIADSRIENLMVNQDISVPKVLLRLPMHSQVSDVVKYADISLNSEMSTIKLLNEEAKKQNKVHKIILMVDLGDLREGIYFDKDIVKEISEIINLKNIEIYGVGSNLSCFGGVMATKENLELLVKIRDDIEAKLNIKIPMVSGGNSSTLYLIDEDQKITGVNNVRLGESLVLGRETAFGELIESTHDDAFTVEAEIIELGEKPSVPFGKIGMDAFGNIPTFEDKGIVKRAILAIGKQDINIDDMFPIDNDIEILGGSSDHLIINITNTKKDYQVGDIVSFKLTYGSLLQASTSKYVDFELRGE